MFSLETCSFYNNETQLYMYKLYYMITNVFFQVLNPENIDQQLNESMNDYLNYTISVDTDILKVLF